MSASALPFRDGPCAASVLATIVGGTLAGPDRLVVGVAALESATGGAVAFHDRGPPGEAGVLFTRKPLADRTCVIVADPLDAFVTLLEVAFPEPPFEGSIHPSAEVHPSVRIGPGVVIGPDCVVGADSTLFPNVVLYPRTRIGRRCRIHAGSILGADGFRYHPTARGPRKVPQVGGVRIGDDVEIGAACTIDRGFLTDTVLGDGCKLDNQVHVGHNGKLGRFVIVAAQSGLSGSCEIGDGVLIGGQVGLAERTVIGAGARIGAQSGLHGEVPAGETWLGTPALPIGTMRRVYGLTRDLPDMWREWRARTRT